MFLTAKRKEIYMFSPHEVKEIIYSGNIEKKINNLYNQIIVIIEDNLKKGKCKFNLSFKCLGIETLSYEEEILLFRRLKEKMNYYGWPDYMLIFTTCFNEQIEFAFNPFAVKP